MNTETRRVQARRLAIGAVAGGVSIAALTLLRDPRHFAPRDDVVGISDGRDGRIRP